ncbi:MAG: TVP38/TMEM64 family protein [Nitrospirota bacterium]
MRKPVRRRVIVISLVVMGAALGVGLGYVFLRGLPEGVWRHLDKEHIQGLIQSAGPWGYAVSVGLMVLHSFVPFPAEFVAMANGMAFGVLMGTALTWSGAMLGAFAAFGLARRLGRPFVRRIFRDRNIGKQERLVADYGARALFLSRFIPVISFNLINYLAGLAGISWWTFAWTTAVGILPITTLMVVLGDSIHDLRWQVWTGLLAAGILLTFLVHRLSRRLGSRL